MPYEKININQPNNNEKNEKKEDEKILEKNNEKKLPPYDEWLINAVENSDNNTKIVEGALKNNANANVMYKGERPLHIAVRTKKSNVDIINILLNHKADINLVNKDFLTSIELAAKNGDYEILKILLNKRERFSKDTFDSYVKYCVDHYIDSLNPEFIAKNHEMIAHYVSRLTGTKIGKLLSKENNSERYVVHLYAFKMSESNQVKLEGWQPEKFLPLRIYSFFEILIKLQKGVIKHFSVSSEDFNKTIKAIEDEILIACENLRIVKDRLAIKKLNEVVTELPEIEIIEKKEKIKKNNSNNTDNKNDKIFEENFDNTCDDYQKQTKLYDILSERIIGHVKNLEEGQSYPVSIGFKDHEIYLTFVKYNEHILLRIDNLGHGSERHEHDINNSALVQPYRLSSILLSNISKDNKLKEYISSVLRLKNSNTVIVKKNSKENQQKKQEDFKKSRNKKLEELLQTGLQEISPEDLKNKTLAISQNLIKKILETAGNLSEENRQKSLKNLEEEQKKYKQNIEEQLDEIYNNSLTANQSLKKEDWPQTISTKEQTAGNCVLESQQVGLFLRSYDKVFFDWLLNQERQCAVNADRKNFSLQADKNADQYWREQLLNDPTISGTKWSFIFKSPSINGVLSYLSNEWVECFIEEKYKSFNIDLSYCYIDNTKRSLSNILTAYQERDFSFLFKIAEEINSSETKNFIIGTAKLFENVNNNINDYESLEEFMEKNKNTIQPSNGFFSFFYLVKGLVTLQVALHYASPFFYYRAKESLKLVLLNLTEKQLAGQIHLFSFFTYYALGICEYYLKEFDSASKQLIIALQKLSLLKKNNDVMFYKQDCLTYLGYLQIEQDKWKEAQEYFVQAEKVAFEPAPPKNPPGIKLISLETPRLLYLKQPKISLGLGCFHQHQASELNKSEQKKESFQKALYCFKESIENNSDTKMQNFTCGKIEEVTIELSSLQSKLEEEKSKNKNNKKRKLDLDKNKLILNNFQVKDNSEKNNNVMKTEANNKSIMSGNLYTTFNQNSNNQFDNSYTK